MPYSQQQTVFVLSMMSNLAASQKGSPDQIEQYLAGQIDKFLAQMKSDIGTWTRAWGPAVFQLPGSSIADNAMYVAVNTSGPAPQYVVGIAGTNPGSIFDWVIEDFFVGVQLPWLYGRPPAGAALSLGSFTGLTVLQFMRPGPGLPGATQTIQAFLKTVVTQPVNVTCAGHSLGGALSPTVALWLLDTQSQWDPQTRATILCEPTAGPTSGNGTFAGYYDQRLGGGTTRLVNRLDMVPHVWNETDLAAIPALYTPDIPVDPGVEAFAGVAEALAQNGDYTQIEADTPPLEGKIATSLIDPKQSAFENYLTQVAYQHVQEYFELLNLLPGSLALLLALLKELGVPGASVAAAAAPAAADASSRATRSSSLRAKLARRGALPAAT